MKFKIKPVKTEFNSYDQMIVNINKEPFGTAITNVSLVDNSDGSKQLISASFTSLPAGQFAFDPSSYCEAVLPAMEKQGLIEKSPIDELHSGFNTYPVYKLSAKIQSKVLARN